MKSDFAQQVQQVFAANGTLAQNNPQYRMRQGQQQMAMAVTHAIEQSSPLVVEAGTGVGKTFAYLVPALLSGKRTLISTATKTLQDQLFTRDLPYLRDLLGIPIKVALLKGRSNYLCPHWLELAHTQHAVQSSTGMQRLLRKVEEFAQTTTTGDLAEMKALPERSPVIPLVTSKRENCLGKECPSFKNCFVNQARKKALASDVVVINHHLFFADLAMKEESSFGALLPHAQTVIFDEAHQLNEIGVLFLGQNITTGQLFDFVRDLLATALTHARGMHDWQQLASDIELSVRNWRLCTKDTALGKWRWQDESPQGVDPDEWQTALQKLMQSLQAAHEALEALSEPAVELQNLSERAAALQVRLALFTQPCPPEMVRWMDVNAKSLSIGQSPLDIAETVQKQMLHAKEQAPTQATALNAEPALQTESEDDLELDWEEQEFLNAYTHSTEEAAEKQAWIFTSATLGAEPQLHWFTEPCGLQQATTLQVPSPFAYGENASIYVPQMPEPAHPEHAAQVAQLAAEAAAILGGRTLVLTTTLRNLQTIGGLLHRRFDSDEDSNIDVLVQGESTKAQLTHRFRQAESMKRGCVLVASASFWEGVDIPGTALQLVMIDKLPFPPPNDPIVEARTNRLKREGKNAFMQYHLPEVSVILKQGAGRLIRHENDRGVLIVCDSRIRSKSYGQQLINALPPMHKLYNHNALIEKLHELNRLRDNIK